jgi:serine protease Do
MRDAKRLIWIGLPLAFFLSVPVSADAQSSVPPEPLPLAAFSQGLEHLAHQVGPSVVQVFAIGFSVASNKTGPAVRHQNIGSGVVLDSEGYIVTNAHVVYGARRLQVQLADSPDPADESHLHMPFRPKGAKIEAQLVGMDMPTDLAVLKIAAEDLAALALGDSDKLKQGQLVMAFGSPLGLSNTVTMGVVSAVDRQLRPDDPMSYVQTDAPINPGNSGGPLVDATGEVVGINTMILTQSGGSEGVGLAIPSNTVKSIYKQLRANGIVRRGIIGVQPQTITPTLASGLSLQQSWGVILADVGPDGPAGGAGLKVGDVVVSLDGHTIYDVAQFGNYIHRHDINSTLTLEVMRGSQHFTYKVPVAAYPDDPSRFLSKVDPEKNSVPRLGILGIEIDKEIACLLPAQRVDAGVLVIAISVEDSTPDDTLLAGDIIHGVNRTPISTMAELRAACAKLKAEDLFVVQVERQGKLLYIAFDEASD